MTPTFSFVSINLNNSDGLLRTIESINRQSFQDWEHIIQDGGSTDSFKDVIRTFPDTRRRVTSEKDAGIYDAMNKALETALGTFIWFINSGDELRDSETLAYVDESQRNLGWMWAYGALEMLDKNLEVKYIEATRRVNLRRVLLGLETYPHPSTIINTDFLRKIGGFQPEFAPASDQELLIRMERVSIPCYLDRPIARFEPAGSSKGHNPRSYEYLFRDIRFRHTKKSAIGYAVDRGYMEARILYRNLSGLRNRRASRD